MIDNKTKLIVQARMNSSRLPGKMGMEIIEDQTLLSYLVSRLARNFGNENIIIATSKSKLDHPIYKWCKDSEIQVFRGNEKDVLKRFVETAKHFNVANIIRVCADNPFLLSDGISRLLEVSNNLKEDYVGFAYKSGLPSIKSHLGLYAELVKLSALIDAMDQTDDDFFHEHVTNYVYGHPDRYKLSWIPIPEYLEGIEHLRLTIDTLTDFQCAREIATELSDQFTARDILNILARKSFLYSKMRSQINLNRK